MSFSYPLSLPASLPLVTLTHPNPTLWIIELHNGQDARLTSTLIDEALKPLLDAVEKHWRENKRAAQKSKNKEGGKGALIIVGRRDQDKFFSNGLDFENVVNVPTFFPLTFNPLLARLLTFPIPTIAAINGHCFAGGFMLSLACDYRVMTDGKSRNAWLCMNEVHFGAIWPTSFTAVLRAKVGDNRVKRKIALEGHRFTPAEALDIGILDYIVGGGTQDVLNKAEELANSVNANAVTGVWGQIKFDLYRDALKWVNGDVRTNDATTEDTLAKARL